VSTELLDITASDRCMAGAPFGATSTPINQVAGDVPVIRAWEEIGARVCPRTIGTALVGVGGLASALAAAWPGSLLPGEAPLGDDVMLIVCSASRRAAAACNEPFQRTNLNRYTGTAIYYLSLDALTGFVQIPARPVTLIAEPIPISPAPNVLTRSAPADPAYASEAYAAFKALGRWLRLNDDDLAELVGVGRTTPYSWERAGHEPRAETARRLYQFHHTVAALMDRLGGPATQRWLVSGEPSPLTLLKDGELERVNQLANDLLFRPERRRPLPGSLIPDDEPDLPPSALAARLTGVGPQESR
jgi:DNA-binding XRE family transcriptional regulator